MMLQQKKSDFIIEMTREFESYEYRGHYILPKSVK